MTKIACQLLLTDLLTFHYCEEDWRLLNENKKRG